ncbi:MAG TPA: hypothetical protein VEL28_11230 [Candidatus Binatia bacterium]|nr:hypothetical protein [Candidatus Binatia bacterium]
MRISSASFGFGLGLCIATTAAAAPVPIDLSTWTVVQYEHASQPDASWVLSDGNTVATQIVNADPSILVADFDIDNTEIIGSWRVDTTNDDDFMGFVFGYQNRCQYYLFDWKKATQDAGTGFGVADVGMSIKEIDTCPDDPTGLDLWDTGTPLRHNDIPWVSFTDYEFRLLFTPGEFTIEITRVSDSMVLESWTVQDDTFTTGAFGFYNSSQDQVRYAGFTVEADELCGNDVLDEGEECDDGNTAGDDCCTFNCLNVPSPQCTTTTTLPATTSTLAPTTTTVPETTTTLAPTTTTLPQTTTTLPPTTTTLPETTTTLPPTTLPPVTTTSTLPATTTTLPETTTTLPPTTTTIVTTTTAEPTTTTTLQTTTSLPVTTTTLVQECPADCGDPATAMGIITAVDAGAILRASVGLRSCEPCVCDVNSNGSINATDALIDLQFAVGLPVTLNCPEFGPL